jgi:acyl-CoA thioester hydrolase
MPAVHRLPVRVRYPEADPMGRLHHSRFLVYFEMGRTEMLRERGVTYRDMETTGRFIAIARADVRYRAGARYDDELIIETWVETIRGARIVFGNRLLRHDGHLGETIIAEATITGALLNAQGQVERFADEDIRFFLGDEGV